MKNLSTRTSQRIATFACVALLFYLSYRYPFQINFSETSQTYSDTPLPLQIGKIIFAAIVCGILLWLAPTPRLSRNYLNFSLITLALSGFTIIKTIICADTDYMNSAFWAFSGICISFFLPTTKPIRLNKTIRWIFIAAAASDFIQIILFFAVGRLPALAWSDSFSVRFGSFLDDPNGFSALCFFFLGWAWAGRSSRWRWIKIIIAITMIVAAQSLTAIGFLAALLAYAFIQSLLRSRGTTLLLWCAGLAILIPLITKLGYETFQLILEIKQGSIDDHTSFGYEILFNKPLTEWLLGTGRFIFFESWWVQAYVNLGLPWTIIHFSLTTYVAWMAKNRSKATPPHRGRELYIGCFTFFVYSIFGSFNLPFFTIFPICFLYFIAARICLTDQEFNLPESSITKIAYKQIQP